MGSAMKHFHPSIIQLFTLFKLLGRGGSLFNKLKKSEEGNFWHIIGETLQWLGKVTWG